jgi:hypothetical protein
VISNKEYPEIEGCSQTVPVWVLINIWNQWLLHDGLLFVGHHIYIHLAPDKFIRFLFQFSRIHTVLSIFWYIGCLTASVQPGVAFVEADIQPIMKNPISFSLAIKAHVAPRLKKSIQGRVNEAHAIVLSLLMNESGQANSITQVERKLKDKDNG